MLILECRILFKCFVKKLMLIRFGGYKMKIYFESEIKEPLYVADLDNGVRILVYGEYAEGSDGRKYHCVMNEIDDDTMEFVGWSCDEDTE